MPRTHLGGSYFKDFGDDILPRAASNAGTFQDSITRKPAADTESTASSSPEQLVATQELGAYPANLVQEYRDGPKKRNRHSLYPDKQHHREQSTTQPTTRRKQTVNRTGFHARPRDTDKINSKGPGSDRSTMLSGRCQPITDPRRLQTSSQTPDTPMGYHDGRRQNHDPQKPTLRGTEPLTFRSRRNKQDVQQYNDLVVAERAGRYREEGKNLLHLL